MTDKLPLPPDPKPYYKAHEYYGAPQKIDLFSGVALHAYGREAQRMALERAAQACDRRSRMDGCDYYDLAEAAKDIRRMIEELK